MPTATDPEIEEISLEEISLSELERLEEMSKYEKEARKNGVQIIAGIDEAGRGPLAGPVVAAACIIPPGIRFPGINDSKKLTALQREKLFEKITTHKRVHYAVGIIYPEEIDRINIYQATIQAMLQAISRLVIQPELLLVDGMMLPHPLIPCQKIIQGDAKSCLIAAASVIAKVTRDNLMSEVYDKEWPVYGFSKHKGYATEEHRLAIQKHGPCSIHRYSFDPIKSMAEKRES